MISKSLFPFFAGLALTLFFSTVSAADYDRALESYLKEDYIQAARGFDRVISQSLSHPKLSQAVYYSAICRLKLEQPKLCIERLQSLMSPASPLDTAVSLPSPAQVRLALGVAYQKLGDETSALHYFESSWLVAPNGFERALAREKIKDWHAAPVVLAAHQPEIREGIWVVQVASNPDLAQAESIRSQIQREGWPVYQETADIRGATFYRIRVGPYRTESAAIDAKGRIQSQLGLSGWVTRK